MKAIFISRQGALIEGSSPRCTLRCGAGAGLALLMDLDFRLIVLDDAGRDGAAGGMDGLGKDDACAAGGTGDLLETALSRHRPPAPPSPPSLPHPGSAFLPQPGRLPDNGRRRRRSDPQCYDAGSCSDQSPCPGGVSPVDDGADPDCDIVVDDGSKETRVRTCWERSVWSADDTPSARNVREIGGAADQGAWEKGGWTSCGWKSGGAWDAGGNAAKAGITPRPSPAAASPSASAPISTSASAPDSASASAPASAPPLATSQAPAAPIIDRLGDLLFREHLALQGYYCCPHGESQSLARQGGRWTSACFCHAPQPGLLLQAAFDHGIDLASSWVIGATLDDVEAGNRAGCRTVIIDNGLETAWRLGRNRVPTRIAPDLHAAALLISDDGNRHPAWKGG